MSVQEFLQKTDNDKIKTLKELRIFYKYVLNSNNYWYRAEVEFIDVEYLLKIKRRFEKYLALCNPGIQIMFL